MYEIRGMTEKVRNTLYRLERTEKAMRILGMWDSADVIAGVIDESHEYLDTIDKMVSGEIDKQLEIAREMENGTVRLMNAMIKGEIKITGEVK